MEILNTIWTALTTENEMLIFLLSIPFSILEITLTTLLFITILNISPTFRQKFTYIISFSVISIVSGLLIPAPYNTFLNVIACPILIFFIFKTTVFKSIMAEILSYIIFIIVGTLTLNTYISLLNITTDMVVVIPIYKILTSVTIYLISFIIYFLFKKFRVNITLLDDMNKKHVTILIIDILIGIITIIVQSYIASTYIEILPGFIVFLSVTTLLTYFIFNIYVLLRTNKLEITTRELEQSRQYNKTLEILHDNIRGFKHDFSNIMTTIGGYVQTGDLEKLRNYYNGLQADCNTINNLNILSPSVINEPAIYSLLTNKYHLAEGKGITVNLEIFIDLRELRIKVYEFTRILGILMDNAIEAAKECDKKIINVAIRKDFHSERQLLIIENTYMNKDVDTEKIYEKGYSSKEHNTGIGLWEVREILKKNENLNLFTSKSEEFFSQQLEIY